MTTLSSLKSKARTAGIFYLLIVITGVFSLMYVPSQIFVYGDAAAMADNIMNSELLYRFGIASNLACQVFFIFLVLALNRLLKSVNEHHAKLMVSLVLVAVAFFSVNIMFQVIPLVLLSGAEFLNVFGQDQLNAFSMASINLYNQGIVVVEIFWGLWLFPFGLLIYRSGFIPRIFGVLLMIACVGYLINSFTGLVFPDFRSSILTVTSITGTVGELSIMLWLLIKGVRDQKTIS